MRSISIKQRYTHTISFSEIEDLFKNNEIKPFPKTDKATEFELNIYDIYVSSKQDSIYLKMIQKGIYVKKVEVYCGEVFYLIIFEISIDPLDESKKELIEVELYKNQSVVFIKNYFDKNQIIAYFKSATNYIEALSNKTPRE